MSGSTPEIAIVSPDVDFIHRIRSILQEKLQCRISGGGDRSTDPEAVRGQSPTIDLVLLDFGSTDGPGRLKNLRADQPEAEILLFFPPHEVLENLRPQAEITSGFLSRACEPADLVRSVETLLERARTRHSLKALLELASALSHCGTTDEVMRYTCKAAVELFAVDHSGFVQFDEQQDHGWARAEYPEIGSIGKYIQVRGVQPEEQVVLHGLPYVSSNVRKDVGFGPVQDHLTSKGIGSILIMPVKVDSRVTASFSLDVWNEGREFKKSEVDLCQAFADQVGMALGNLRRQEDIEFLRRSWAASDKIGRQSTEADLRKTLQSIVDLAVQELGVEVASLYTYDESCRRFTLCVGTGHREGTLRDPKDLELGSSLYQLLELPSPITTEDTPNHGLFRRSDFVVRERIASTFAMRLLYEKETVGVLLMNYRYVDENYREGHKFRADEIRTFEQFGRQAAIRIRVARLQDGYRKRLAALEALNKVGDVADAYKMKEALQRVVSQALTVVGLEGSLDSSICHIAVLDGDRLKFLVASSSVVLSKLQKDVGEIDLTWKDRKIGLVGRAILNDATLNAGDVQSPEYAVDYIPYGPDMRSELVVLLKVGERIFGTLSVESPEVNAFSTEAERNLEHLADYAEMAIQNSRHFTFIDSLIAASQQLVPQTGMLSDSLRQIAETLVSLFACDGVSIYAYNSETDEISYPSVIAGSPLYEPDRQADPALMNLSRRIPLRSLEPGTINALIDRGEAVFVSQHAADHPIVGAGKFARRERLEAVAAIPLSKNPKATARSDIVGFLFLNYRRLHPFTEQEQKDITVFSLYIARAMEYYNQYDELIRMRTDAVDMSIAAWIDYFIRSSNQKIDDLVVDIRANLSLFTQVMEQNRQHFPRDVASRLDTYLKRIGILAGRIQRNPLPPAMDPQRVRAVRPDTAVKKAALAYRGLPGVDIKFEPSAQTGTILANPKWIAYGLENLLDYCLQSQKNSPEREIRVRVDVDNSKAQIIISAPGMPAARVPLDGGRSGEASLMSLPFKTARAVFRIYGGDIQMSPDPPRGTKFTVAFPTGGGRQTVKAR